MKLYILWIAATLLGLLSCSSTPEVLSGDENGTVQPVGPETKPLHEWQSEDLIQTVEAEEGSYENANLQKEKAGYSGKGYLSGFWSDKAKVTVTVEVPERAFYRLNLVGYVNGGNSHSLIINNRAEEAAKFTLPICVSKGFEKIDMGKYLLDKGTNTITFQGEWGDVFIDKFEIYTAIRYKYDIANTLVDPSANAAAKELYRYLLSNFGTKMIAGFLDGEPVNGVTDRKPVIYGWDFASYTEGYPWHWSNEANNGKGGHVFGAEDNGNVKAAIDWYNNTQKKGIVTFHWHWGSPSGCNPGVNTFYTENTSFSVSEAVKDGTEENRLVLRDIDAIAVQLKRLQDAGVPVLWRPLHEAGGGWFWWGAEGPTPCIKLYNILYDRLTNYHQIHNLIWVWSTGEKDWYPGNGKVDIIGYDSYPGNYNVGVQNFMYNALYKLTEGKKIIAMTENGPIPDPDACIEQDTPWAWFMSWGDLLYKQNTQQHIYNVFHHEKVVSLIK